MTEIALELGYDNFYYFPSCSEKSTDVHRESFKKKDEKMSDLFRTFFVYKKKNNKERMICAV